MIVDLALKGASPDDLAVLRRLLASDGRIDGHFVTARKHAESDQIGMGIDMVQLALDSSSVGPAASVLAFWLSSRPAEVEMRVERVGIFSSFKSGGFAQLADGCRRTNRSASTSDAQLT
jgi:Effector Associated Constant Component 1